MAISTDAIRRHLDYLCERLGPRPIGSPANNAAAAYIGRELAAIGLEAEEQRYPCIAWECVDARLEVGSGGTRGRRVPLTVNAYSASCDVTGHIVPVGTVAELECTTLRGRIGLLYGDLARAPIAPKSWFLKTERDDQIIGLLEKAGAAAFLAVDYGTPELGQLLQDSELDLASATVSWDTALSLLKDPAEKVRLMIQARKTQSTTANLVARRPDARSGARPQRIVLCAHHDTAINTPGACDNGGGVAALLALAASLQNTRYGLEFVFFTGEEYLPMGDDEYLRRMGGEKGESFSLISAAINMDGAGAALGSNSITAISCSSEYEQEVRQAARRRPGVVWVDPWPQSNHSTFSWRGVPSLALSSVGERRFAHRPEDGVECVSIPRLAEAATLVEEIVTGIQGRSPEWLR